MSEIVTFLAACGIVFGPMVAWCLVERRRMTAAIKEKP